VNYQTFAPPESLKPFIKFFWAFSTDIDSPEMTLRAFPDGCPGVIMVQSDTAVCDIHKKKLPAIYLHGQPVKASELTYSGKFLAIGINFQPYALRSIFGLNANELTNTGIDLTCIHTKQSINLAEQLVNDETVEGRIKRLSNYLLYQHQHNIRQTDETVKYAIALITQSKGNLPLKELQQKLQLSERSLERRFSQVIGISAKLFSRIVRFQETLDQLRTNNYDKLSDIAYENEYFDQSYFIRVFKEFTGFSPLEYKKCMQSNGVCGK
jgi:AraC-like DNA-binding protein